MHSTTSSTSSVPAAVKKSSSSRPILTDRQKPVEINGNSISVSQTKNSPQKKPSQHAAHVCLPYIKTQSAVSSIQQRKVRNRNKITSSFYYDLLSYS